MFRQFAIWLYCFVIVFGLVEVSAQKSGKKTSPKTPEVVWDESKSPKYETTKITEQTNILSPYFPGHDPALLFDRLQSLLANIPKNADTPEARLKHLENQALLGDLTVNDWFAFSPQKPDLVLAVREGKWKEEFRGYKYRLRFEEFPEPKYIYDGGRGCGPPGGMGGISLPKITTKGEGAPSFVSSIPPELVWRKGIFHLRTDVPIYRKQTYKGKIITVGSNSDTPCRLIVPSPQRHYLLAFTEAQPWRLVKTEEFVFSLNSYEPPELRLGDIIRGNPNAAGPGIIAWQYEGVQPPANWADDAPEPLFLVKLVPPYIETKTLELRDPVEGKMHRVIVNKLYVKLDKIWLIGRKSGKVLSRNAGDIASK